MRVSDLTSVPSRSTQSGSVGGGINAVSSSEATEVGKKGVLPYGYGDYRTSRRFMNVQTPFGSQKPKLSQSGQRHYHLF